MIDREKVINGLEHCIEKLDAVTNKTHGFNCMACPYFKRCDSSGHLIGLPLMKDVLALLKAQDPRVMTLEEVAGMVALERETIIYMEFGNNSSHAGKVIALIPKYMYFDDENGLSWLICEGPEKGKKDSVSLFEYNDVWRCWTSRPDEKVRETPWRIDDGNTNG